MFAANQPGLSYLCKEQTLRMRLPKSSRGIWLFIGQFSFAASQGVAFFIVGRFGGTEAVGLYSLALAIVSPVFIVGRLRLQDVLATDSEPLRKADEYLRLTVFGASAALALSLLFAWVWNVEGLVNITFALACSKVAESISKLSYGYRQGDGDFRAITTSLFARSAVGTAALAIGYWLGGLSFGMWAMALAWLTAASALDLPLIVRVRVPSPVLILRREDWKVIAHLLPLGVAAMAVSINQSVIRNVVVARVGLNELGLFTVSAYVVRIGVLLARAISQSLSPKLRSAISTKDTRKIWDYCYSAALRTFSFSIPLGVAVVLIGPLAFPVIFGPEFTPGRNLLSAILAAGLFLFASMPLSMGLVAHGLHRAQMVILLATLAITTILAFILTGPFGVTGAALAWAVGQAIRTSLLSYQLFRISVASAATR